MNWFEIVNTATKYIEDNITSEIALENVAKQCNVSYYYFSKIFTMLTGYGLKEYIRNRRITLASYEISYTKERIIDIAFKYGYSSNESFSRAFRKIHGINPSDARKNKVTVYTHFPVLTYDIPTQNLISLRYEIIENIDKIFNGISIKVVEKDYEETQRTLLLFEQDFAKKLHIQDPLTHKPTLYRVRHHLSDDSLRYQYLVGFDKNDKIVSLEDTIEIKIKAKKAVVFVSRSITGDMIPKIKKVIYDEWCKNQFQIDGVCEIEYTKINDVKKLDFFYLVSIK